MTEATKDSEFVDFAVTARKYKTLLTKKFKNRKVWEAPNPNNIKSYIPGTIIELNVKPGQKVKQGELLLRLEAMKMQNRIDMPFDGIIKSVNVNVGEKIPKNFLMIEIE
ncbi:MAG TPA: biotin/lipoyl-binding protein [Paludibacteraceae bacterium]|nr:biotin/lipoyl-binding protein [Paludibacteraceae bacterium]HOH74535.1 biotin/lipoyl-binding protein [Paludibacteraceae bacterium]